MNPLSNYKILVVDDEPDVLQFICTILEDNGLTVLKAIDGEEALIAARTEMPDLITLDIQMPKMDGGKVFEIMRNDPDLKKIPVCIISGKPELRRLIYQRNVPPPEGYLDKPIEEKKLLLTVKKILSLYNRKEKEIRE